MILVVGDVMTDVLVRPAGPPAPGTDQAAAIRQLPGGSAANLACWLGAAGVPVRFAGRVGAADADAHAAALRRHGVEPCLAVDPTRATGTVVAVLGDGGERGFYTDRGANAALSAADLPPALLLGVRHLHVSGHAFVAPGPRAAVRSLLAAAREIGISVDAGSAGWLARAPAGGFAEWMQPARLCFANRDEAAWLDGLGAATLVVTDGAAGAELREGGRVLRVAAEAGPVVDGTGAGDAFAAGFLAAMLAGADPAACLVRAAALAAVCVRRPGGRPDCGTIADDDP